MTNINMLEFEDESFRYKKVVRLKKDRKSILSGIIIDRSKVDCILENFGTVYSVYQHLSVYLRSLRYINHTS